MKILIQKFGGTSVSSLERREMVAQKVKNAINDGFSPVVVVSAMGRKGEPYATDSLISLISSKFKNENTQAADLLMSCGEIISTVVMTEELGKIDVDAVPLTGGQAGIITDSNFSNANFIRLEKDKLLNILSEGKVPVVAGFQGISEDGAITTLGRGGSDLTAAILGASLKAEKIEIYKDVDGIMTADPRIVKNASLIKEISYNEVFQFADQGAKVIHPRAVEVAMKANIPLIIKNTLNNCDGTIIDSDGDRESTNIITGITHRAGRVQITIAKNDNISNENYINILGELAENYISIDLINVFPDQKIFTIDENDFDNFKKVMCKLNLKYSFLMNCSKIAVIGSRMSGIPGVMASILRALSSKNIKILQTADSYTTIWCLVKSESIETAINALHEEFNLG